jgi:hypothetical protein
MGVTSNIDDETSIFDPYLDFRAKELDTRTAARVFSCYMTLLECAAAQYFHAESSRFVKPVESKPSPKQPETTSNLLVEYLFEACSKELEDGYQKAVASGRSTTSEAEPASSRLLLIVTKNTDAQMVENKQGESEGHVEPSSTSDNEDNIYHDSDGKQYRATTPKGNTVQEKSPFTAEGCGRIAHVLIAAWSQQVQIIE